MINMPAKPMIACWGTLSPTCQLPLSLGVRADKYAANRAGGSFQSVRFWKNTGY